ncbi:GNAT family N-acetyltransferase [uncultured Bacteroides sp.]|uniref:GNAT family N-acetyltransferase n=1 Tax=uncultured Bacteroides sp. TaxID=162156 RepID=UPI002AABD2BE|nr:GNAT family N-acetyltransferase [uncultured Bacteroides sp.]
MPLRLTTYYRGNDIPDLPGNNIFHSRELFLMYEAAPGYTPILIVASEGDKFIAKMLITIRRNTRFFPPNFIKRCEIYGTGEYLDEQIDQESIFGEILEHFTNDVLREAFFIEFRNLENPMFAYKYFRKNHYFPVNWLRVHNSLHSLKYAEERFSTSRIRQIKKGLKNGAEVYEAHSIEEIKGFSRIMKRIYSSRIRRYFPGFEFFKHMDTRMIHEGLGKIFIVKYKEKIIGGSVCVYSGKNAYLWFSGGMRKTHVLQYPGVLSVWAAIKDAYENGFEHIEFIDVGLPFSKHGYRDFVLRFGGKQSSTRRWFRTRWKWLNKLLIRIYV